MPETRSGRTEDGHSAPTTEESSAKSPLPEQASPTLPISTSSASAEPAAKPQLLTTNTSPESSSESTSAQARRSSVDKDVRSSDSSSNNLELLDFKLTVNSSTPIPGYLTVAKVSWTTPDGTTALTPRSVLKIPLAEGSTHPDVKSNCP
jgi:hypothetical protein